MGDDNTLIFRITQKLAKKIKIVPDFALPQADNPFLDWTANLFSVSHYQYIVLTNTRSLYSVVFRGKGVSDANSFIDYSLDALQSYMIHDRTISIVEPYITPPIDSIVFSKTGDRRVLGSMNDLIGMAKLYLQEPGIPLTVVNERINDAPMSMLGYQHPKAVFLLLGNG